MDLNWVVSGYLLFYVAQIDYSRPMFWATRRIQTQGWEDLLKVEAEPVDLKDSSNQDVDGFLKADNHRNGRVCHMLAAKYFVLMGKSVGIHMVSGTMLPVTSEAHLFRWLAGNSSHKLDVMAQFG